MSGIVSLGGVRFRAEMSLPGVDLGPDGTAEVVIEAAGCPLLRFREGDHEYSLPGGYIHLESEDPLRGRLVEGPQFEVDCSSRVIRIFSTRIPDLRRTHEIVDGILPLFLSTLSGIVLHGAVLADCGSAVAVLGDSFSGKSTLTAHFVATGGAFLSDDWFRLTVNEGYCVAHPSHPAIRLRSREVVALDEHRDAVLETSPRYGKFWYRFPADGTAFGTTEEPLRAIVFLDRIETRTEPATLRLLVPAEAFLRVASHLILAQPRSADRWREKVALLFQIVESLPAYQLTTPSGEAGLQTSRALLSDLLRSTSARTPPPRQSHDEDG